MTRHVVVALFATLAWTTPAFAQEGPIGTFPNLSSTVKRGTIVFVTDDNGEQVKGTITEVSPASMQILTVDREARRVTFAADRVSRVARVDSRRNGFLIGAALGAVPGILLGMGVSTYCENESTSCPWAPVILGGLFGAAGGGIGYAIDGAIDGQKVVYSRMPNPGVAIRVRF